MTRNLAWRLSLVLFFILISFVYLTPTLVSRLPSWWSGVLPKDRIHFGLDLQGGSHLVMEVETQEAVKASLDIMAADIEDILSNGKIRYLRVAREGEDAVKITLFERGSVDGVRQQVSRKYPEMEVVEPAETDGNVNLLLRMKQKAIRDKKDKSVEQALETIRNRIDQFGVSEPVIQREGTGNIVVQLPGISDPKRAIELIGKTARLEFRLVSEDVDPTSATPASIPEDDEILMERHVDTAIQAASETPLVVKKKAIITGDLLSDAQVGFESQFNQPYVAIEFNSAGARLFDQITAGNVGKRFAVVLDGKVHSAPVIRERISGGSAQISGSFTEKEASDLALVLRAGALPAPVKVVQNLTVGPSLGQDSIRKGLIAGLVGVSLVVVFMTVYYRASGLVANLGMALNILFLMGALAVLGATLTLPGIAAIVLLVGMSVDSSILIFERIREELRLGRTARMSLDAGYEKAFWTIMDSHITTLITAAVLFQFGTGPVKGFAVSLSLGVIINLFTSLFATKALFDLGLRSGRVKKLSI